MSLGRTIENIRQKGEQLMVLLQEDRTKLEPRLGPGVIDGMVEDLKMLSKTATGVMDARQAVKSATLQQNQAARMLYELVMAMRKALKLNNVDPTVLKRAGVDKHVTQNTLSSILQAALMMQSTYAEFPEILRQVGVLPVDMEQLETFIRQLSTVDQLQERAKQVAKEKTVIRNEAYKRAKRAISAILGAAELAFVNQPERLTLYRALWPVQSQPRRAHVTSPLPNVES